MHPPLLFLRVRRKRRAPCAVEKKKRAFAADLGGPSLYFAVQVVRALCGLVPGSDAESSLDRAPRWCGVWNVYGTERVFFCTSIASMCKDALRQGCFAALLFCCCCAMRWCGAGKCSIGCVSFAVRRLRPQQTLQQFLIQSHAITSFLF